MGTTPFITGNNSGARNVVGFAGLVEDAAKVDDVRDVGTDDAEFQFGCTEGKCAEEN